MISSEFVSELAEVMGVAQTELATVDRVLAKKGLRQIARGRFRPDITLEEGLQILLAWAGTEALTQAADELERLQHFCLVEHELTIEDDAGFEIIFGSKYNDLAGESFFELLILAARNLGRDKYPPEGLWLVVEKKGGVDINYRSSNRRKHLNLGYFGKFEFPKPGSQRNVSVSVRISGRVLKWLFDVTEGA
jgi:hypothetical protein